MCFMIRLTDGVASISPNPRVYRGKGICSDRFFRLSPAHRLVLVNLPILFLKLSFGSGL